MGAASKAFNVGLRIWELICAAIVTGIVGEYVHYTTDAHAHNDSKIIYTLALGGISILFSLILLPPFKHAFWAFPFDLALFIMWMVSFGLLEGLTGSARCNSYWYWSSWGYYWGGWYRTVPITSANAALVGTAGCSQWRATLAFDFIGGFTWLFSAILGGIIVVKSRTDKPSRDEYHPQTQISTTNGNLEREKLQTDSAV